LKNSIFVPGHITGFFEIHLDNDDPQKCGSRGAGFCIDKGAYTYVNLTRSEKFNVEVLLNGEPAPPGNPNRRVVELMAGGEPYDIIVETFFDLPISQGLGLSGAGALSTAAALNDAMGLSADLEVLTGYAHQAEVESRTGLGDVIAQGLGGLEVRKKPGAPPFGIIERVPWETQVLLVVFQPPVETKVVIQNEEMKKAINDLGFKLIDQLGEVPAPEKFLSFSREFTERSGLASEKLLQALSEVPEGYGCGMAMLGNTLFITGKDAHKLSGAFEKSGECIQTRIYNEGLF
jgi:pantoate kinase